MGSSEIQTLPLLTLYLTERCNSRCISCDYWRTGRRDLSLEQLEALLPALRKLGTREVLISGGEPLLHPEWADIADRLLAQDLRLWLLTAGLALAKHAQAAAQRFERITVSLDGADRASYAAIRGVDAFDAVCAGVRAAVQAGTHVNLRVTVQRGNFRQLPQFVALARSLGAASVSFLAADLANTAAFGREHEQGAVSGLAIAGEELDDFAQVLNQLERSEAQAFTQRFIEESPLKLRRLHSYYTALAGQGPFPTVHCNAPEFSAVMQADGQVRPCFFIPGPPALPKADLQAVLNAPAMRMLRENIANGHRPECERCVCAKWREPEVAVSA
ncbi:radical SAM/SPASM domain-containing protein [Burkholderiaceae bacterium UC74_6]